jgi:hypothetical protein
MVLSSRGGGSHEGRSLLEVMVSLYVRRVIIDVLSEIFALGT